MHKPLLSSTKSKSHWILFRNKNKIRQHISIDKIDFICLRVSWRKSILVLDRGAQANNSIPTWKTIFLFLWLKNLGQKYFGLQRITVHRTVCKNALSIFRLNDLPVASWLLWNNNKTRAGSSWELLLWLPHNHLICILHLYLGNSYALLVRQLSEWYEALHTDVKMDVLMSKFKKSEYGRLDVLLYRLSSINGA